MEKVFKALGDFTRVRIINLLQRERLCVSELSNIMQISISAVSRHLSRLNLVGIIDDEPEAQWVYYVISNKFADSNKLLFDYIMQIAKTNKTLGNDIIRCQRYKASEYCCKDFKDYKENVGKVMDGKND